MEEFHTENDLFILLARQIRKVACAALQMMTCTFEAVTTDSAKATESSRMIYIIGLFLFEEFVSLLDIE